MNAFQTEPYDLIYSDRPPILIAASSDAAAARAVRTIEAAGYRIADGTSLSTARERIERQVAASAVWLELDRDCGGEMDDVLGFVDSTAADGRFGAVVSASSDLIDTVAARIGDAAVELIVDADEPQRIGALALASARAGMGRRLSDIASDQNAERLRQLSDEVGRIAATLARLSSGPAALTQSFNRGPADAAPDVSADTVRSVIRARRLRTRFFPEHLFADPAIVAIEKVLGELV